VRQGFLVRAALRKNKEILTDAELMVVGEIDGKTDWRKALIDVDIVIHLAARVHVMHENTSDPLEEFRRVNVAGTEQLARAAVESGVKRLVYVSSIGVNGLATADDQAFSEKNKTFPHNAYAISKWEAEQLLLRLSKESELEVVIVRPPLVYGVDAPGNFEKMMKALAQEIPLPLASANNRRSLIYIENLVDALILCAMHPVAEGQTYLVCDGDDVSTPDLLRQLGAAMGHPARLFPCHLALLRFAGHLLGKKEQIERLLGSLRVDSDKIRSELNWRPPYTLHEGLRKTGESFAAKLKIELE
jgi:nucleoside-diphosphate-sugar epimerase